MKNGTLETSLADSPHAAVIVNPRGMVVHWNEAAEKLFGWTAAEIEGRPAFFLAPEDRTFFLTCLQDKHSGGLNHLRCCRKDGARLELAVALMPVLGHSAEDAHCLGLFLGDRDRHSGLTPAEKITRVGMASLREIGDCDEVVERLHFESLVSNISAGLIQITSLGLDDLLNASLEAIRSFFGADQIVLSYAPRMRRQDLEIFVGQDNQLQNLGGHPGRVPRLDELLRYLFRANSFRFTEPQEIPAHWQAERDLAGKFGISSGLWVRLSVADKHLGVIALNHRQPGPHWGPDTDHRLQLLGEILAGALHRRRVEEDLAEAKRFYDSVVTNIPVAVFVKHAHDLSFAFLNKAAERLAGLPLDQVRGRTNEEIFAPEDAASFTAQDRQVLESGILLETDRQPFCSRSLGARYLRSLKIPVLNEQGVSKYLVGITEDITESLTAAEENARLKARLIEARRLDSLATLAGGLAHDFNNILYGIIGYTHLARELAGHDQEILKALDHVLQGGQRASKLVQQIQALSKPAAGKLEPVSLKSLVQEALDLSGKTLAPKVSLTSELDGSAPSVLADSAGLFQALMGVLTDMGLASGLPRGTSRLHLHLGSAEVSEAGPCLVGVLTPGRYAKIVLNAPDLELPTDPQRFLDPGMAVGSGGRQEVNLAHLASVVSGHHGALELGRDPDGGFRLDIYLPAIGDPDPDGSATTFLASPRADLEILFVDEAESVSRLVTESLNLQGYHVTHCTSATASREAFLENPNGWAAVIIDDPLPFMSWVELVGQLRSVNSTVPIIFLHEAGEGPSEDQLQEVGVADSISKPVNIQHLTRSLQDLIQVG